MVYAFFFFVFCFVRKKDGERSAKKEGARGGLEGFRYASVELAEQGLLEYLPRHNHVVELLGYLLDAPQPGGTERNLALILPLYEGGSLESFVKARKGKYLYFSHHPSYRSIYVDVLSYLSALSF